MVGWFAVGVIACVGGCLLGWLMVRSLNRLGGRLAGWLGGQWRV